MGGITALDVGNSVKEVAAAAADEFCFGAVVEVAISNGTDESNFVSSVASTEVVSPVMSAVENVIRRVNSSRISAGYIAILILHIAKVLKR